jgi:hypothetical protein
MTFKHPDKSQPESSTSPQGQDKELQKLQARVNRFMASGKKIVEMHCDPPSPFYVDPKSGTILSLRRSRRNE